MRIWKVLLSFALVCISGTALADGVNPVGRYFSNVAVGAGTVVQVVAPSANVGGLYLRTTTMYLNPSTGVVQLYANTTPPAGVFDPNSRAILAAAATTSGVGFVNLPEGLYLAPGLGLYAAANIAAWVMTSYDLQQ